MNIARKLNHRTDYHATSISRQRNSIATVFKEVFHLKQPMIVVHQFNTKHFRKLFNNGLNKIIKYRETTPPYSLFKAAAMLFVEVT